MIPNLFGLGAALGAPSTAEIAHAAETLLSVVRPLTPEAVRDYLLVIPSEQWKDAGFALVERGATPAVVAAGLQLAQKKKRIPWSVIGGVVTLASAATSAYHGARRNQSVGWAIWWFTMGLLFPVITPTVAVAQGFGRPRKEK